MTAGSIGGRILAAGLVLGSATAFASPLVPAGTQPATSGGGVAPHHGAAAASPAARPARASGAPLVAVRPPATRPAAPAASVVVAPTPPASTAPVIAKGIVPQQLRINIAWQIALEAADFSPGVIDGHFKRKSLMALNEYAARYFPGVQPFDVTVYNALKVDVDGAVATYTVTSDDAMQVVHIPEDWNEKARLERMGYESLIDEVTERFHCTRVLLEAMNPGVNMDALEPGRTLNVPAIRPFPEGDNKPTVLKRAGATSYVTVNLAEKTIRLFDKDDKEIALFHCSVARDKEKLPDRDTKVQVIAAPNPNYTFDPKNWPEVTDVTRVLTIPPGPRNPVGLAWVGLDLPGYGMHGTPKPELIGKTGSHGCFRLTNWDALKLAGMVKEGMAVKIINPDKNAAGE